MVQTYDSNSKYYVDSEYFGMPGSVYFGAHNGVFRMTPAKHQSTCWEFDPRGRPWFVAASSGPKDVVLVLDISLHMDHHDDRFQRAKDAAIMVIDTLTVVNTIAVIVFNETAVVLGNEQFLVPATEANKNNIKSVINSLEAGGTNNFTNAFNETFNILHNSIPNGHTAARECNVAIILLSEGSLPEQSQDDLVQATDELTEFVQDGVDNFKATYFDRNVTIFTYTLGDESNVDVMKRIACNTNGIWTHISDNESENLISAMGAYYKLFASGLAADNSYEDFVAWVEPYVFKSDGKLGTTVSVPVFYGDLLLGVVGVDIYMETLQEIMGENATEWMKEWIKGQVSEYVPKIHPSECQLEALRSLGGPNSTCGNCSSGYEHLLPKNCSAEASYSLWENEECKCIARLIWCLINKIMCLPQGNEICVSPVKDMEYPNKTCCTKECSTSSPTPRPTPRPTPSPTQNTTEPNLFPPGRVDTPIPLPIPTPAPTKNPNPNRSAIITSSVVLAIELLVALFGLAHYYHMFNLNWNPIQSLKARIHSWRANRANNAP